MKYICLKMLSDEKAKFIEKSIIERIDNIYILNRRFKTFNNIILFFDDERVDEINLAISSVFRMFVEKFYEDKIIQKKIKENYFYLDENEQKYVYKISRKILEFPDYKIGNKREILKKIFYRYLRENRKVVMEGIVNFRMQKYKNTLDNIIDVSVISYLNI